MSTSGGTFKTRGRAIRTRHPILVGRKGFSTASSAFGGYGVVRMCRIITVCFYETCTRGDLADETLSALQDTFAQFGRHPSQAMWAGIKALSRDLEGMANGPLRLLAYLSSLDPGVGKTEAVVHFIRELCASPWHRHVGVLVCVAQLSEIGRLARNIGLKTHEYAVYTSDEETNALGTRISTARGCCLSPAILLIADSDGKESKDPLSLFSYKGDPRQVRSWMKLAAGRGTDPDR